MPVPAAIVTQVMIQRKGAGLHSVAKIPVAAGGSGSAVDFKFKLGRTYAPKGEQVGYFESQMPGRQVQGLDPKILFKNEARVPGVAAQTVLKGGLFVPCTPKG